MGSAVITRFAPSPSGYLHLGHAFAALFAHEATAREHGRFLLRIEDIDATRCRPEYEAAIAEDLAWLGLTWDGPVLRQSERSGAYAAAIDRLRDLDVLYPCFCTRAAIRAEIAGSASAPHGPEGPLYPGTCRAIARGEQVKRVAAGEQHALRLDVHRAVALVAARGGPTLTWRDRAAGVVACAPEALGDVVLARREIGVSYHLAVTVDDAFQGVTLVTRGADLFHATHVHRLLQAVLELPVPEYHHHRLIAGADGRRLATRDGATALRALRAAGRTAVDVRREIGWGEEPANALPAPR